MVNVMAILQHIVGAEKEREEERKKIAKNLQWHSTLNTVSFCAQIWKKRIWKRTKQLTTDFDLLQT